MYNEQADLVLTGCTLHQNVARGDGGAILTLSGDLVLINCTFSENMTEAGTGGGIYNMRGKSALTNCTFSSNLADEEGGGVATDYNSVTVTNCRFSGNSARWGGGMNNSHYGATVTNCIFTGNSAQKGGGICSYYLYSGDLTINNCTFSGNVADTYGGAVCNWLDGNVGLINCILWGNSANEGPHIAMEKTGTLSISYSCVQGGEWDVYAPQADLDWLSGNIDTDPCFADEAGGDVHLWSTVGRWDANTNNWVTDDANSPCIDAGDPNSTWTAELWPHGKQINMGAFGGMAQASMSDSDTGNIADLDCSGAVDGVDLRLITDNWLYQQALLSEDLDRDGLIDGGDFAIFADNWAWKQ
ncbi:MAG: right-handed parallel beta-helix repeat-containing protein [Planctomycetota bacterium]